MTPPRPHRDPTLVISFSLLSVTSSVLAHLSRREKTRSLYRVLLSFLPGSTRPSIVYYRFPCFFCLLRSLLPERVHF